MNAQTLTDRKLNLIVQITKLGDEESLRHIEDAFSDLNKKEITERQRELLEKLARPIREKLDIEELIKQQNWKPSNNEEIEEIIKDFDWEISDEDFIRELKSI
jgi:uncharacterized protein YjgD (DUF1641 family)